MPSSAGAARGRKMDGVRSGAPEGQPAGLGEGACLLGYGEGALGALRSGILRHREKALVRFSLCRSDASWTLFRCGCSG